MYLFYFIIFHGGLFKWNFGTDLKFGFPCFSLCVYKFTPFFIFSFSVCPVLSFCYFLSVFICYFCFSFALSCFFVSCFFVLITISFTSLIIFHRIYCLISVIIFSHQHKRASQVATGLSDI